MAEKLWTGSWFRYITYIYLFFIFSGVFSGDSEQNVYICMGVYIVLFLVYAMSCRTIRISRKLVAVACLFTGVWIYGYVVGGLRGNDAGLMIRTFAGMLAYLVFIPVTASGADTGKIIKLMLAVSAAVPVVTILAYLDAKLLSQPVMPDIPFLNAYIGGGGFGNGFVQYYNNKFIYLAYSYSLYKVLHDGKLYLIHVINIVLDLFAVFCFFDSGGDILAVAVITVLIFWSVRRRFHTLAMVLVLAGITGYFCFCLAKGTTMLGYVFSGMDIGNQRRYFEVRYILNDLAFWGNGLGARLMEAGAGTYGLNYGTEVIYLNLVHKFGIVSAAIFGIYVYTAVKAFFLLDHADGNPYKVLPLACMGYLIPALGNPLLFSGITVFLHCFALTFIWDCEKDGCSMAALYEKGRRKARKIHWRAVS